MTTGEIQAHLEELYGTSISKDTISRIPDAVVADMEAWQARPLDSMYPVVLIDAIVIKVRDSQVANRPVYVARRGAAPGKAHRPESPGGRLLTSEGEADLHHAEAHQPRQGENVGG